MLDAFKKYLAGLRPTHSGIMAVGLCLLLIPMLADLVFVAVRLGQRKGEVVTATVPLLNAYIKALPLYILYLLVFFIVAYSWKYRHRLTGKNKE